MSSLMQGLGSACVSHAGERVLAIANFCFTSRVQRAATPKRSSFRRDAETNTRDACAPQR